MSMVINAPYVEGRLQTEAAKHGVSASEYAVNILATHLEPRGDNRSKAPFYATATPEQWNAEFDAWVDGHSARQTLPGFALSRESFYEDGE